MKLNRERDDLQKKWYDNQIRGRVSERAERGQKEGEIRMTNLAMDDGKNYKNYGIIPIFHFYLLDIPFDQFFKNSQINKIKVVGYLNNWKIHNTIRAKNTSHPHYPQKEEPIRFKLNKIDSNDVVHPLRETAKNCYTPRHENLISFLPYRQV